MSYIVGWNMPGYMPDSEPYEVDTLADAVAALAEEVERSLDGVDGDDEAWSVRQHEHVLETLKGETDPYPPGMEYYAGNYVYWYAPMEEL